MRIFQFLLVILAFPGIISISLYSQTKEDRLTRSTLKDVESIAEKIRTLEELGKVTMTQSAVMLDLKESAVPELLKTLQRPDTNWKVRFWIVDLLGYVGNQKTVPPLLKIIGNETEKQLIRLKAIRSIHEIRKKMQKKSVESLRNDLRKMARKIKSRRVKREIAVTIQEWK